jgi:hypothetical protein
VIIVLTPHLNDLIRYLGYLSILNFVGIYKEIVVFYMTNKRGNLPLLMA